MLRAFSPYCIKSFYSTLRIPVSYYTDTLLEGVAACRVYVHGQENLCRSFASIIYSNSPKTLIESATTNPAKLFLASTDPAALPPEDAGVADALADALAEDVADDEGREVAKVDPVAAVAEVSDDPVLPLAVVVALLSEADVDAESLELVLVLAADPEPAVLDGAASPFWTSNQLAPTG